VAEHINSAYGKKVIHAVEDKILEEDELWNVMFVTVDGQESLQGTDDRMHTSSD
jgi:hypothetical protein